MDRLETLREEMLDELKLRFMVATTDEDRRSLWNQISLLVKAQKEREQAA